VLYQLSYLGQEFLPMRRYFTRMEHACQALLFLGVDIQHICHPLTVQGNGNFIQSPGL
jgi:hypothetical protein